MSTKDIKRTRNLKLSQPVVFIWDRNHLTRILLVSLLKMLMTRSTMKIKLIHMPEQPRKLIIMVNLRLLKRSLSQIDFQKQVLKYQVFIHLRDILKASLGPQISNLDSKPWSRRKIGNLIFWTWIQKLEKIQELQVIINTWP